MRGWLAPGCPGSGTWDPPPPDQPGGEVRVPSGCLLPAEGPAARWAWTRGAHADKALGRAGGQALAMMGGGRAAQTEQQHWRGWRGPGGP